MKDQRGIGVEFYSSFKLGLDVGGWTTPCPDRFAPGKKTRYPLCRSLGGTHIPSGRVRKTSPTSRFDSRIVQPIANRYTDWAIPAQYCCLYFTFFLWITYYLQVQNPYFIFFGQIQLFDNYVLSCILWSVLWNVSHTHIFSFKNDHHWIKAETIFAQLTQLIAYCISPSLFSKIYCWASYQDSEVNCFSTVSPLQCALALIFHFRS